MDASLLQYGSVGYPEVLEQLQDSQFAGAAPVAVRLSVPQGGVSMRLPVPQKFLVLLGRPWDENLHGNALPPKRVQTLHLIAFTEKTDKNLSQLSSAALAACRLHQKALPS